MTISIKEYAATVGISEAAAYKRMNSEKYSRFLVLDEHGRKCVNTAIFDAVQAVQPDSTNSTRDSTFSTTEVEVLRVKLEYAQRDNERLEQQLADLRQQITAKDQQLADLSERLRESHILVQFAQQRKPRLLLSGIIERIRGRKESNEPNE